MRAARYSGTPSRAHRRAEIPGYAPAGARSGYRKAVVAPAGERGDRISFPAKPTITKLRIVGMKMTDRQKPRNLSRGELSSAATYCVGAVRAKITLMPGCAASKAGIRVCCQIGRPSLRQLSMAGVTSCAAAGSPISAEAAPHSRRVLVVVHCGICARRSRVSSPLAGAARVHRLCRALLEEPA